MLGLTRPKDRGSRGNWPRDSAVRNERRSSMIDNQGRSTMAHTDDHPTAPVSIADVAKDGVMPGGVVPFRLPAGALNYLDRNQYISNMEVIAYYPKIDIAIFGDEHSCLWAKG